MERQLRWELLYDCGIYSDRDARRLLGKAIRALGEFYGKGKVQEEATQIFRACRALIRDKEAQRDYAIWILDEVKREAEEAAGQAVDDPQELGHGIAA